MAIVANSFVLASVGIIAGLVFSTRVGAVTVLPSLMLARLMLRRRRGFREFTPVWNGPGRPSPGHWRVKNVRRYSGASAPPNLTDLVQRLTPVLIAGDHPASLALRAQWRHARVVTVTTAPYGFSAHFALTGDASAADTSDTLAASADVRLTDTSSPATCELVVLEGRLAALHGTCDGPEGWPFHARLLDVTAVRPLADRWELAEPRAGATERTGRDGGR